MRLIEYKSAVAVVAAIGLGCGCHRADPRPAQASAQAVGQDVSPSIAPTETSVSERSARYSLHGEFLTEMGASPKTLVRIDGELWVSRVAGTEHTRRFQIHRGIASASKGDREVWKADPIELHSPFYVVEADTGRAQSMWLKSNASLEVRRLFETIAAELQLDSRHAKGPKWQSQEADNLGKYTTEYERTQPNRITKRKTAYLSVVPTLIGKPVPARIAQSDLRFELDARDNLVAASINEVLEVEAIQLRSGFSLKLDAYALVNPTGADAIGPAASEYVQYEMGQASVGTRSEQDQALTNGLDWARVLDLLHADMRAPDRSDLRQRIAAMLRLKPELANTVLATVRSDPKVGEDLMGALVHAATPEAQDALGSIIGDTSLDKTQREYAAIFSGRIRTPTPALLETLWREFSNPSSPIRNVSGFACGTLIGTLHTHPTELSKQLFEDLLNRASNARDSEERSYLLGVLGNTGIVDALSVITRFSNSKDVSERSQAVRAVRGIQSEKSVTLVRQALGDRELRVRQAALESARALGTEKFSEALQAAVRRESIESVRLEMLNSLRTCQPTKSWLATVDWLLRNDGSSRVRAVAAQLKTISPSGTQARHLPKPSGKNADG